MKETNVIDLEGRVNCTDPLSELLRTGAQQLIRQAVEAELTEFLGAYSERKMRKRQSIYVAAELIFEPAVFSRLFSTTALSTLNGSRRYGHNWWIDIKERRRILPLEHSTI